MDGNLVKSGFVRILMRIYCFSTELHNTQYAVECINSKHKILCS